ncbi:hypothetical protein DFH09DRAFT_1509388 [Mycena vulgaris]|nr:hypothetical protein DFH09DRAFT_1509388 [Mycena vulgaris]
MTTRATSKLSQDAERTYDVGDATDRVLERTDRTNIGNTRLAGLQKDLNMTNREYTIALPLIYVAYVASSRPYKMKGPISGSLIFLRHSSLLLPFPGHFRASWPTESYVSMGSEGIRAQRGHARFLSQQEKDYVAEKLREDGVISKDAKFDAFTWSEVTGRAFTSPQVALVGIIYFLNGW